MKDSRRKEIHLVAAARPNFMKVAPLYHALKKEYWPEPIIVHTGQHYDVNMSDAFLQNLGLPDPPIHLNIGSGSHAEQTGQVMIAYEKILMSRRPELVVVVGDVNSTAAATLAAVKLGVTVAHLEAGLRSFDRTMPEEINRIVTDAIADILWTPSADADDNLRREGIPSEKIERVGNIMIDSLEMHRSRIEEEACYQEYGLEPGKYIVVTLHRPSNVDPPETLSRLCQSLVRVSEKIPIIFPIHPRTKKNLELTGLLPFITDRKGLFVTGPLDYIHFMNLVFHCRFAITDSGGIQEETTYLNIPCLTLRASTERPITLTEGTNRLATIENIQEQAEAILSQKGAKRRVPALWDGQTASRVVASIRRRI